MSCNWVLYKDTIAMLSGALRDSARMSLHWANDGKGQVGPDGRRVYVTDAGWVHLQRELVKPEPDLTMHMAITSTAPTSSDARPSGALRARHARWISCASWTPSHR